MHIIQGWWRRFSISSLFVLFSVEVLKRLASTSLFFFVFNPPNSPHRHFLFWWFYQQGIQEVVVFWESQVIIALKVWHAHQMTTSPVQYPIVCLLQKNIVYIFLYRTVDWHTETWTNHQLSMLCFGFIADMVDRCVDRCVDRWVRCVDALIVWQNKGVILTHVFCWKWGRRGHFLIVTQFYSLVLWEHFCTTLFKPDIIMCYLNF